MREASYSPRCIICGTEVNWVKVEGEEVKLNSPMLNNLNWYRVRRYYDIPRESFVCEDCMREAIGELTRFKLRDCEATRDWREYKSKEKANEWFKALLEKEKEYEG